MTGTATTMGAYIRGLDAFPATVRASIEDGLPGLFVEGSGNRLKCASACAARSKCRDSPCRSAGAFALSWSHLWFSTAFRPRSTSPWQWQFSRPQGKSRQSTARSGSFRHARPRKPSIGQARCLLRIEAGRRGGAPPRNSCRSRKASSRLRLL